MIPFGPAVQSQGYKLQSRDDEGNCTAARIKAESLTVVDSFRGYVILSYKVPANVTKIRIANPAAVNNIFTVTKNDPFTVEEFGEYWMATEEREAALAPFGKYFTPKTDSALYQKSALVVGDSISYGSQENSIFGFDAWADRIASVNDMTYTNASISGAACATAGMRVPRITEYQDGYIFFQNQSPRM